MSLKYTNPKEYVDFLRKQLNSLTDKNEIVIQYYDELGRKISHVIYKNGDNFTIERLSLNHESSITYNEDETIFFMLVNNIVNLYFVKNHKLYERSNTSC